MGNSLIGKAVASRVARKPHLPQARTSKKAGRINLQAVAEVLAEHGLDPTVELVRILKTDQLDPDVQVRVLNELLQYTQPKLKSVEIRAKVAGTSFDINDEQAKRIAEEFLKASTGND